MKQWSVTALIGALIFLVSGCAMSRQGVMGLTQSESDYFGKLQIMLADHRKDLDAGLTDQLKADLVRQRNLLAWQRDLEKAEIILQQQSGNVTGQQRLLSMKLAESDLASANRVAALDDIDVARKQLIMGLYDKVVTAVAAVGKNTAAILAYMESSDAEFALRSLDIDGMFRLAGDIQAARVELQHLDAKAQQTEQSRIEEAEKAVTRARDLLIKIYAR
jgi:hypothetical protein